MRGETVHFTFLKNAVHSKKETLENGLSWITAHIQYISEMSQNEKRMD